MTLSRLSALAMLIAALGYVPYAFAQNGAASAWRGFLKEGEEGELIRRRQEWFYGQRRVGADGRMAELRGIAAEAALVAEASNEAPVAAPAWVPRGPFGAKFSGWRFKYVSGRIAALEKDFANNVIYAGSASGGLWKSSDDGVSWAPIFDRAGTMTIGAIGLDARSPGTIWAGTGENSAWCEEYFGIGLLRSLDGGSTWQKRNGSGQASLANLSTFCSILVDPRSSDRVVVGGSTRYCKSGSSSAGGVFTTENGGATWTERLTGAVTRIARNASKPDVMWAGVGDAGVYRSSDGGRTWTLQAGLPSGNVGRVEVAVAPSDGSYVYALFEWTSLGPQLWRTTNGGSSWKAMASARNACDGQCWYNMVLKVDVASPDTLYRGTIQLFKSTDGGAHWTNLIKSWGPWQLVHQDIHALVMDPSTPQSFYVGSDGGVWKTVNGGLTFTHMNSNMCFTQFYDVGIDQDNNDVILGGAQDNASLARTTSDTWNLMEATGDGFISIISQNDPTRVFTASYPWGTNAGTLPGVLRSTAGIGGPFSWITGDASGIAPGDRVDWVTPYDLDATRPGRMFLGTHRVYRSDDYGSSWTQVGPLDMTLSERADVSSVVVAPGNGSFVYAGTSDGRIWRSTDGGTNWTDISAGLPARSVTDVAPDPSNPGRALCTVSGFNANHVYEYTGSGSWIARDTGLPNIPANTINFVNAKTVYVGTDVGVYRSMNRGVSWQPFNSGMPAGLVITDLEYNRKTKTLTAGTYGRGAWQLRLGAE